MALSGASRTKQIPSSNSWSPAVRNRAAEALARKPNPPLQALLGKLRASRLETRYGACQAFARLGQKASPALPELRKALQAEDLWPRVLAAEAIAAMGSAGMPALPDLLEQMAWHGPGKEDPHGMEQRYLSFSIFGTMLARSSLEGIDREALRQAIAAGLTNEDGKARTAASGMYDKLTLEEIRPLLPAIRDAKMLQPSIDRLEALIRSIEN